MDLECNSGGDFLFYRQVYITVWIYFCLKMARVFTLAFPSCAPPKKKKKKSCQGCYLCSLVFTVAKKKIKSDRLSL